MRNLEIHKYQKYRYSRMQNIEKYKNTKNIEIQKYKKYRNAKIHSTEEEIMLPGWRCKEV